MRLTLSCATIIKLSGKSMTTHTRHTLKISTLESERDMLRRGMAFNFTLGYQMRVPSQRRITVDCRAAPSQVSMLMQVVETFLTTLNSQIYIQIPYLGNGVFHCL